MKSPKKLPDNLDKKLRVYSIAAGAVVLGGTALQAAVHYTDVSPDAVLDTNGETFNIQFVGETKFKIYFVSSTDTYTTTTTPTPGNYGTATFTYTNSLVGVVAQTANASFIGYAGYDACASALAKSYIISEGNNDFARPGSEGNMASYDGRRGDSWGYFIGKDKYLGLKFTIDGNTHYGWARVEVASDASWVKIKEYAYEDIPDLGIKAGEQDVSLPVELSSFSAMLDNGSVLLSWQTESELENLGFILERRTIGKSESDWSEIASYKTHPALQGHGSTSSGNHYSFKDESIVAGKGYEYRLADVSFDGAVEYHESVRIQAPESEAITGLQEAYPNPFNSSTTIAYRLAEEAPVSLQIVDLMGRTVRVFSRNQPQSAGSYTLNWNGKNNTGRDMSSGVYFVILKINDKVSSQKIILAR